MYQSTRDQVSEIFNKHKIDFDKRSRVSNQENYINKTANNGKSKINTLSLNFLISGLDVCVLMFCLALSLINFYCFVILDILVQCISVTNSFLVFYFVKSSIIDFSLKSNLKSKTVKVTHFYHNYLRFFSAYTCIVKSGFFLLRKKSTFQP